MSFSPDRPDFASRLRHRPMRRSDVAECMGLLPPWLELDAEQRSLLPALWERLVYEPGVVTGVSEETALPPGQRLQGWGTTLVMPAQWLHEVALACTAQPELGTVATRAVYQALLDGRLQVPSEREIAQANAGDGVVFLALHYYQLRVDLSSPYALRLLSMANEAYRMHHAGYRVRAVFQQASQADEPWLNGAGFRRRHAALPGPAAMQPVLYGVTREEAAAMLPGITARHVFEHQVPRFRLTSTQRRLLWLALFDESDAHLMPLLEVSVHGLKKLWRGIYERIEDVEPAFFGDAAASEDEGKRGPEKRRQVLAYVRQRPEELRPWP